MLNLKKQNMKMKKIYLLLMAVGMLVWSSCSKEDTYNITPSGVTSDFTFSVSDLQVTFTNSASKYKSFIWVFGDGTSSTELNPVHVYPNGGEFKAQLTAFGAEGAVALSSQSFTLVDPRPVSKFKIDQSELTVTLTNQSTLSGQAATYEWDFGDNTAKVTTQNASHSYPELLDNNVKTYTITLKVTTAKGTNTSTQDINIFPVPTADFTFEDDPSATGDQIGRKIIFTSAATNATAYSWDFGDHSSSDQSQVVHLFAVTGYTYQVKFTASNPRRSVTITKSLSL
jgi:PKD repeat protein